MLNVRLATPDDRDEVLTLVRGLLTELGGNPAPKESLYEAFNRLVAGGDAGFIVIAEVEGVARGCLHRVFRNSTAHGGTLLHPAGDVRGAGVPEYRSGHGRHRIRAAARC